MFTSNNLFQKTSQILTTQLSQWTTSVINKRSIILCWCCSHQLASGSDINSWTWLNCRICSIISSNIRISWHHGFASKILVRMSYFHSVTKTDNRQLNWLWFSSSTLFTLKADILCHIPDATDNSEFEPAVPEPVEATAAATGSTTKGSELSDQTELAPVTRQRGLG